MKKAILLAAGIIATVLFLAFPSQTFELGYYYPEFSNEMYNEGLYLVVATFSAAMAWGGAALFYYAINSVSFSRWYHWLIVMLCSSLAAMLFANVYPEQVFSALGYDFSSHLFKFGFVDFLVTALLFTLASFAIRWWSSNCRHTPFPE